MTAAERGDVPDDIDSELGQQRVAETSTGWRRDPRGWKRINTQWKRSINLLCLRFTLWLSFLWSPSPCWKEASRYLPDPSSFSCRLVRSFSTSLPSFLSRSFKIRTIFSFSLALVEEFFDHLVLFRLGG